MNCRNRRLQAANNSTGIYDFDGQLNSTTFSSHPKIDVETGEMVGFGMEATGIG